MNWFITLEFIVDTDIKKVDLQFEAKVDKKWTYQVNFHIYRNGAHL